MAFKHKFYQIGLAIALSFSFSIVSAQVRSSVEDLENKLLEIESFLVDANKVLIKYEEFVSGYYSRLESLLDHGARCAVKKHEYEVAQSNSTYAFAVTAAKRIYEQCEQMRVNRTADLESLQNKFELLEKKIDEIGVMKDIKINEAQEFRYYIEQLKKDRRFE